MIIKYVLFLFIVFIILYKKYIDVVMAIKVIDFSSIGNGDVG